ncbi:hypothetical protein SEA_SKOG_168 [Gordonia phage Skog]|uniref:Uncharacterized protein n=1 Tax=Gordonia phage Skog TaxID=2704033 RepID=A0A6G6XKN0_9CAUD|nr:hypothetical protein KHQ85_gp168 [Gordonia phage Skog]QIG58320.1 hypothetical protein SEA_SKOG_168 [Gordonia phage Skog]
MMEKTMTAPTMTEGRKTLRQLRESTETLYAQNNTRSKVSCNTDKVTFGLEPAGREDSIAVMPKECLDVPGFQRLWMKGAVSISDNPEMENKIALITAGQGNQGPMVTVVDEKTGEESMVAATLGQSPNARDISIRTDAEGVAVQSHCIISGKPIFQTQQQIEAGEPPLHADYQHRAHEVVSTPQADGSWTHQLATFNTVQRSN